MKTKLFTALFCLLSFPLLTRGQSLQHSPGDSSRLAIRVRSNTFFRNNEYFNPLAEGYTLTGWYIQPTIEFHADNKLNLSFGAHILNYNGTAKPEKPRLIFSTTYQFTESTSLTIGTIKGAAFHDLPDQVFNKERIYTDFVENGLQVISRNERISSDTWIDWEHFIFKGDTEREIINAGESFRYILRNKDDKFSLELPASLVFRHLGGQISNYPQHVITTANLTGGVKLNVPVSNSRYTAGIEYTAFLFKELTGKGDFGVTSGYANHIRLLLSRGIFDISGGYWKSHDFFAPLGNRIFSSVSDYQNTIIRDRDLITISAQISYSPFDYLEFYAAFEGFYDPSENRFDNALCLHLKFDRFFNLLGYKL
ncbi:MAG: hypothetical protein U0X39_06790 [Bacteroidales bacterium]